MGVRVGVGVRVYAFARAFGARAPVHACVRVCSACGGLDFSCDTTQ